MWQKFKDSSHQYITRFLYQPGLLLNFVKVKNFQDMIDSISVYGPNFLAPTYHEIRILLLTKKLTTLRSC